MRVGADGFGAGSPVQWKTWRAKIISNSALRAFAAEHPQADELLRGWRRVIEKNRFGSWAELKAAFKTIDKVGDLTVFNIGGNKVRLIAAIHYNRRKV